MSDMPSSHAKEILPPSGTEIIHRLHGHGNAVTTLGYLRIDNEAADKIGHVTTHNRDDGPDVLEKTE